MMKKIGWILIGTLFLILPMAIIPTSHARRDTRTSQQALQNVKSNDITTRLPISVKQRLSSKDLSIGQQDKAPARSYAERMGKGKDTASKYPDNVDEMSATGRIAYLAAYAREHGGKGKVGGIGIDNSGCLSDDPECEDEEGGVGLNDKQSEMGIAVDPSGMHVVVGYNDAQGFATNPNKLSGFATSHDGGVTFTTIGTMPSPGNQSIGATLYPQIFGDPDIKWLPAPSTPNGGVFIYASIMVRTITGPSAVAGTVQTMCIHRSLDFGDTWQGPFEVTSATNPNGLFTGNNARDTSDKEFIDVDPDTNRVMIAWSNFSSVTSPVGKEMLTSFSDDLATAATPTWSTPVNVNLGGTVPGQGIIPRFAGGGSPNVYVTYQSQTTSVASQQIFARSTDNGVTFTPAVALTAATYKFIDQIQGNDRAHTFPWMAVDNSPVVATKGNIYVVYADNTLNDGSDIVFQKSVDGGLNFTPPVTLNARPGMDRPQWFPVVTVDTTTGRVWVFYYDQGVADSGDVTETSAVYSDDGGTTWSRQISLTDRPFHGGYGNDTGQPNLGDYNMGWAQGGNLYSTFAYTPPIVNFADGQVGTTLPAIDFFFKKTNETPARAGLEIRNQPPGGVSMLEKPTTQTGELTIPLTNITTNPLDTPTTYTGVSATLTTSTPNVSVTTGVSAYPDIASGVTQNNTTTYIVQFAPAFVWGTKVDFALNITTAQGNRTLVFSENTGNAPIITNLINENFDAAAQPALPAGWVNTHVGGLNTVPWGTASNKPKTNAVVSRGLYHANANDNGTGDPTRREEADSPQFIVPANSRFVSVDFDLAYDTEDDPSFIYQAYDGSVVDMVDFTAGRTARRVLAEAFADEITTGGIFHYPKHFPRSNSTRYYQDMSAWSGDSTTVPGNNANGYLHVHMLFPGMASSTAQLRISFAQDSNGICTDVRPSDTNCGVLIDNVVINSIAYSAPTAADTLVSGLVLDSSGAPLGGVAMTLSGAQSQRTMTDAAGRYAFRGLKAGEFYTISPALSNYSFSPANRSFSLTSNVTDASFTAMPDAVSSVNAIDSTDYFVRQQYLDFLDREPDQGGLDYWTSQIAQCGGDETCVHNRRIDVSAAFFIEQEFQQTGSFIYRLYKAGLGRQLSYSEFTQDHKLISAGGGQLDRSRESFVESFVESSEFVQRYSSATNADSYVEALLQSVQQSTGLDLSSARSRLVGIYDQNRGIREKRAEVLKALIEEASLKEAVYNSSFVMMQYYGYLHRDYDQGGYDFWLNVLNNREPGNYRGMVCSFITSTEYQKRFGSVVSHSNSECAR